MGRPAAVRLPAEARRLFLQAARLSPDGCFLVGGSVRDALLDRPFSDLDLAAPQARSLAQALARELGGTFVALDEEEGVYRVALREPRGGIRQIDVARLQGRGIDEDLARRDFTVNALALAPGRPQLIDPRGGAADLRRRLLRTESDAGFKADPLRLLRGFRLGAQLGFRLEGRTASAMARLRSRAASAAGERIRTELMDLLASPGCAPWLEAMDRAGILTTVIPELEPSRRCAVIYYGRGGVLRHSLETASRADYLLSNLPAVWPDQSAAIHPDRPLIMLAALLHDVSKPETARTIDGRLRFFGHDLKGAERAASILRRLRFSRDEIQTVSAIVAHHLRPGHLAAGGPLTDKAAYRFFRDLGGDAAPLLLVCWADHASYLPQARLRRLLGAARAAPGDGLGRLRPENARKTVLHLQVVAELLRRLLSPAGPPVPKPLLDGHEVMRALKLGPGPAVGQALERLREAQAEGRVRTRKDALDFLTSREPK